MPFNDSKYIKTVALPFALTDYLQLITDTMNAERNNDTYKTTKLPSRLLSKLGMTKENWQLVTSNFETLFTGPVGCPEMMEDFARCCQRACRPNVTNAQRYLS